MIVARSGQLSRAARNLNVDATTVGRRVRRLERMLGSVLFEQTRSGQVLTETGARLLARVEGMADIAGGISPSAAEPAEVSGLVRVSVSEGFGTWFVAGHLGGFAAAHPKVTVDLVANSGFLSPSRGEADVAVLLARPRRGPRKRPVSRVLPR